MMKDQKRFIYYGEDLKHQEIMMEGISHKKIMDASNQVIKENIRFTRSKKIKLDPGIDLSYGKKSETKDI